MYKNTDEIINSYQNSKRYGRERVKIQHTRAAKEVTWRHSDLHQFTRRQPSSYVHQVHSRPLLQTESQTVLIISLVMISKHKFKLPFYLFAAK